MLTLLAFNFIVNSALSFAGTALLVWLVLRLFRPGADGWQLPLLALPWVKVVWDMLRGIPEGSFFWHVLRGLRQDSGSFQLGLGLSYGGPTLQLRLGARLGEELYPQSAGDLALAALSRVEPDLPALVSVAVLSVSGALVLRRLLGWHLQARWRRAGQEARLCMTRGRVRVVIDARHSGPPYAEGVLKPRVVFAAEHYGALSAAEREACLEHELAHVAHRDTLVWPLLSLLSDALWFLPGSRFLLERWRAVMELRADTAAIRAGARREALASALVTAGEQLSARAAGVGLTQERLLSRRVRRLLGADDEPLPRAGFQHAGVRLVLIALIALGVLQSVFFGNQPF